MALDLTKGWKNTHGFEKVALGDSESVPVSRAAYAKNK